jgi:hypothetical protein
MTLFRIRAALSRRRKGAVALVAVAAMLPVAGMLTASLNSSQMVDDRRSTQDAADALSRMHGVWAARSMNILAMNSVTETQLLTVALGSESLMGTLIEMYTTAGLATTHISTHAAAECQTRLPYAIDAWWVPICAGIHVLVAIPAGIAVVRAIGIQSTYDPMHGIDVSRKGLEAIEGMNRALIERFPRSVREIGEDYADVLEVDTFHFDDPCDSSLAKNCESGRSRDGMALPLKEGGFQARAARCVAMDLGTTLQSTTFNARGFPIGRGPNRAGGSDSEPVVKDFINDETDVGEMLDDFKTAYDDGGIAHLLPKWLFIGVTEHPDWANLQGDQDTDGPNSFTRRYDSKYATLCSAGGLLGVNLGGFSPIIEAPVPTAWELEGISFFAPRPVHPEDMPEEFQILAFGQKEKSMRLGAEVFVDADEPHNAYGQTGLYNPDGADIYSQNWRYRLMPALRMDAPGEVAGRMDDRAPADFAEIADVLDGIGDLASWRRIHAH